VIRSTAQEADLPHVTCRLEDGSSVVFEVEEGSQAGPQPVSRISEALEKAEQSFDRSLDSIRNFAGAVLEKLRQAPEPPQEIQLVFGLKALAEISGFAIAKASAEANYTVTLKWVKPPK
jgi:hypothetical protein